MLKTGCISLSVWAVLNLVASLFVVANTLFLDGHTPALNSILTTSEVTSLGSDVLATIDSIAVFANGVNIAFSSVALSIIWLVLYHRQSWAFWILLVGFAIALLSGVAADYVVGTVAPGINAASAGILATGFVLSAIGIFGSDPGTDVGPEAGTTSARANH